MLMRCTRGFRWKANDQISQISLIDNVRNMVGIKLYFTTYTTESESKIDIQQRSEAIQSYNRKPLSSTEKLSL